MLAAGAAGASHQIDSDQAPEPGAQFSPPWEAPVPAGSKASQGQVAETLIQGSEAEPMPSDASPEDRDSTTLIPAWQPPPASPAPGPVAATAAVDKTEPMVGAASGAGRQADLMIETGPDAGHSHRLGDHPLRLGRSPDNDVILRDPATSGHHARLERRGDQFWIVDLGSTNGTLVNGEPVQEKELNDGDRVTIGQNAVQFSLIGS
ncbi:MAG: FHA domain-containing protein, partial [Candidatus Dormibacteraeota bacterium]|nr:FHA domain-containing protein [Candidatus Dormibacteraeota bacterium]